MKKFLKANHREITFFLSSFGVVFGLICLLQSADVADSAVLSQLVAMVVTFLKGALRFVACLGLGWLGLAITLPEASKFIVGKEFDVWWDGDKETGAYGLPAGRKAIISLAFAAVLIISASLSFLQ